MSTTAAAPNCPKCSKPMRLRSGKFGTFWGCLAFPACRGTREVTEVLQGTSTSRFDSPSENRANTAKAEEEEPVKPAYKKPDLSGYAPLVKMPGSPEQENIWKYMLKGKGHMVVSACAGSGKSWSLIQGCLRMPKTLDILFVAFNKHIALEAQGKLRASGCTNVRACTYHSLGYSILRNHFKGIGAPNENKVTEILEDLSPIPAFGKAEWRKGLNLATKLVGICKNYLLTPGTANFQEELERLADHHGLEMNGSFKQAVELLPLTLQECRKRAAVSIDYDDMIWLPIELDLTPVENCDIMIIDEVQDLNLIQHELTFKVCFQGRVMAIGDPRQAIFGFRGACATSMQDLEKRLSETDRGVKTFPLTITRRCPKLHVQMAQAIVPQIQALDDAPIGEIQSMPQDKAIALMKPGDMCVCRVNAALIPTAYALIRRGIKPVIRGHQIGKGLLDLLAKLEKSAALYNDPRGELTALAEALSVYRYEQETKLLPLGEKAEGRLGALHDKCDCLLEFITNSTSVVDMRARIESIFSDFDPEGKPNNAVVLGTVHRTKGLEAERVFVLAPELVPGPWARKPWELEQEANLAYVAVTRAKFDNATGAQGTIVFCGAIPAIFAGKPVVT